MSNPSKKQQDLNVSQQASFGWPPTSINSKVYTKDRVKIYEEIDNKNKTKRSSTQKLKKYVHV